VMDELNFEFEHEGRTVRPGQLMHVAPHAWWQAGPHGKVERFFGNSVMLRSDNGAVPHVSLDCISWEPFPETIAREELRSAGFTRPTNRDVAVWMAARTPATQAERKEK